MTTIRDVIKDVIVDVLEAEGEAQKDGETLTPEAINMIVDEVCETIKERIVG